MQCDFRQFSVMLSALMSHGHCHAAPAAPKLPLHKAIHHTSSTIDSRNSLPPYDKPQILCHGQPVIPASSQSFVCASSHRSGAHAFHKVPPQPLVQGTERRRRRCRPLDAVLPCGRPRAPGVHQRRHVIARLAVPQRKAHDPSLGRRHSWGLAGAWAVERHPLRRNPRCTAICGCRGRTCGS